MNRYKMKLCYLVFCLFFFTIQGVFSQTASGTSHDEWAQDGYDELVANGRPMAAHDAASKILLDSIAEIISKEHSSLTTMSNDFILQRFKVINFIDVTSKGYFNSLYPLVSLPGYGNGNSLGNIVVRNRYKKKIDLEKENVIDYFNVNNPISEGDRLLLLLGAMETIVRRTLENVEPQNPDN